MWGPQEKEIQPKGEIFPSWRRKIEKGCKVVESGGHQGGKGQQL